jgi:hypothetical protein
MLVAACDVQAVVFLLLYVMGPQLDGSTYCL